MTTYRIECFDDRMGWTLAPGDATGWTLRDARRAVSAGLHWLDGDPIPPDRVRIVKESA